MRVLLASHTSAGLQGVIDWLNEQPEVELVAEYRIEYIKDELAESKEPFDLILSSPTGRPLGMNGDDIEAIVHFPAAKDYATARDIPYVPLYNGNELRSTDDLVGQLQKHFS